MQVIPEEAGRKGEQEETEVELQETRVYLNKNYEFNLEAKKYNLDVMGNLSD